MATLKNIIFFIFLSFVTNVCAYYLKSDFIGKFLRDNLVLIVITLLAINTATCGLLITNIKESAGNKLHHFKETFDEIKFSLVEQIYLIVFSVIILILDASLLLKDCIPHHALFFDTLLGGAFIYSIDLLRDTGISIFNTINYTND
jgi:hypothetical protein